MRRLTIIVLVIALPALLVAAAAPDTVTLDGCGEKQAAVTFSHKAHAESAECVTCHHTNEGLTAENAGEVATCQSCHLSPEDEATLDCAQMSLKKNPYHVNCIDCHKQKEAGPTKCAECHPKE